MRDSLDKIIFQYFSSVTNEIFTYKNKFYFPKTLSISPLLLRTGICVSGCGACCQNYTLDYLPREAEDNSPYPLKERMIEFNGKQFQIFSDLQDDHSDFNCRNLIKDVSHPQYSQFPGGCGIHDRHPFSCDFEFIRFFTAKKPEGINRVNTSKFTRGWIMKRIDGIRGVMCEMKPATEESRAVAVRKLKRLKEWVDYFQLENKVQKIIIWAEKVDLNTIRPLVVYNSSKRGLENIVE